MHAANHAPIATGASISADQNKPIIISLKASDSDKDDKLTFLALPGSPSHGIIAGFNKNTGSLTYIPNKGFSGQDVIRFKVTDNQGAESNEASSLYFCRRLNHTHTIHPKNTPSSTTKQIPTSPLPANNSTTTTTTVHYPSCKYILCKVTLSSPISDRLEQRLAEIQAKIKETRGQKIANQYIIVLKSDLSTAIEAQALANDAKVRHGAKLLQMYQKSTQRLYSISSKPTSTRSNTKQF